MIRHRISVYLILRRAEMKRRAAEVQRAERDHLARPHVQSVHMVGYWTPPAAPTAREQGITPRYVAMLLALACTVAYLNINHDAAPVYACAQIASTTGAIK